MYFQEFFLYSQTWLGKKKFGKIYIPIAYLYFYLWIIDPNHQKVRPTNKALEICVKELFRANSEAFDIREMTQNDTRYLNIRFKNEKNH